MATAKQGEKLERSYSIPLRREIMKSPKYRRAKKAVTSVKEFLQKHMKAETIKIGPQLNLKLWERGIQNPPTKIKVHATRENNVVKVELEGVEYKALQFKPKTEASTGLKGKLKGLLGGAGAEKKEEATAAKGGLEALAGEKKTNSAENKEGKESKIAPSPVQNK